MDKIPFLVDIDDELEYSQSLELLWNHTLQHLIGMDHRFPSGLDSQLTSTMNNEYHFIDAVNASHTDLKYVIHTMGHILTNMVARRKRLADIAVGLTDGEVDEERP